MAISGLAWTTGPSTVPQAARTYRMGTDLVPSAKHLPRRTCEAVNERGDRIAPRQQSVQEETVGHHVDKHRVRPYLGDSSGEVLGQTRRSEPTARLGTYSTAPAQSSEPGSPAKTTHSWPLSVSSLVSPRTYVAMPPTPAICGVSCRILIRAPSGRMDTPAPPPSATPRVWKRSKRARRCGSPVPVDAHLRRRVAHGLVLLQRR